MRKVFILLTLALTASSTFAQLTDAQDAYPITTSDARIYQNKGQLPENVHQVIPMFGAAIYLEDGRITYDVKDDAELYHHDHAEDHDENEVITIRSHVHHVSLKNAAHSSWKGEKFFQDHANFYLGNDPSKWATKVPIASVATLSQPWNGIDMRMYGRSGSLSYDFVLAPQADPSQIVMVYDGLESMSLEEGNLILHNSVGTVMEGKPSAFQEKGGHLIPVDCDFVLKGNEVSFKLGNYDKNLSLWIDPVLIFSTYSGGTYDDWGMTATYDSDGNLYAGGMQYGGPVGVTNYPVTGGAYQVTYSGGVSDVVVTKFNNVGNSIEFSTYIGGSGQEQPHSMVVHKTSYELYVMGRTNSTNFPIQGQGLGFDDTQNGNYDAFVMRFDIDGILLNGTFIGGSGSDMVNGSPNPTTVTLLKQNFADDARGEIILDANGDCIIGGVTASAVGFPIQGNNNNASSPIQATFAGGTTDGFVTKLDANLEMIWSTYLGGSDSDAVYSLKVDGVTIVLAGGTASANLFPLGASGVIPTYEGGVGQERVDGFICRINVFGETVIDATYINNNYDGSNSRPAEYQQVYIIEVGEDGSVYAFGQCGANFPVTGVDPFSPVVNAGARQFVMKMDNSLSSWIYSAPFGGTNGTDGRIVPTAFTIDNCENIYLCGWGSNLAAGFRPASSTGLPTTSGAPQTTTDGSDFYLAVMDKDMADLLLGTFWGSPTGTGDHVDGGTSRYDQNGIIYQAVCSACGAGAGAFPTTPGAWSNTQPGSNTNCNLAVFKMDFDFNQATADIRPDRFEGCAPLTVNFSNYSDASAEVTYIWDFGDGTVVSNTPQPAHTFTLPGTYVVNMYLYDNLRCDNLLPADTAQIIIDVYPVPSVDLTDATICLGQTTQIFSSASSGSSILWTPSTGLSDPTVPDPLANPTTTTTYNIEVTLGSCTITDFVTIIVDPCTLAVALQDFTGIFWRESAQLHWMVSDELNFAGYELEKSINGKDDFRKIAYVPAAGKNQYDWIDNTINPNDKVLYYRLKLIDLDGTQKYADQIVEIWLDKTVAFFQIAPSPVTNSFVILPNASSVSLENALLSIYDVNGKEQQRINLSNNAANQPIDASNFAAGTYFATVTLQDGSRSTLKWVKQ